jgi:hypothetical protein
MSSGLKAMFDGNAALLRALLRAGQARAMVQDYIDCAEIAVANNSRDIAAILYGLVALQIGFSPPSLALLRDVEDRAGLWGRLPAAEPVSRDGFSVDLALDELRRLILFGAKLQPLKSDFFSFPAGVPMGAQPRRALDANLEALARRAAEALRSAPEAAAGGGLSSLLLPLTDDVLTLSPIQIEEFADTDIETLAFVLALEGTRRFVVTNVALLTTEPATLFDAAAGLIPGALGPFFTNVRMLLRGTADVFALIDAAAVGGKADAATTECWAVLLSAYLPNDRLVSLAAEMGDRGMVSGLHRLLERAARADGNQRSFDLVYGIRDASLDIDAFTVAGDAQELAARWHRADSGEWSRLGEIRAYGGDLPAARAAFEYALQMKPGDRNAQAKLALAAGEGIVFEEINFARRNLRRARLGAFNVSKQDGRYE